MNWFESWFDTPYYHQLYQHRDAGEASNFLKKLCHYLNLEAGARVTDLACGKGRHSISLHSMGYQVLGLDLSEQSIRHNQSTYPFERLRFKRHDMREPFPSSEPQDAVFNLFTSFGYFDSAKEDLQVFRSVYQALKPGGYFVLDFLNEVQIRKNLKPIEIIDRPERKFHISRKIENNKVIKDIRFETEKGPEHFYERVSLYNLETIRGYAQETDFDVLEIFGDYQLSKFDLNQSPRALHLLRKKCY